MHGFDPDGQSNLGEVLKDSVIEPFHTVVEPSELRWVNPGPMDLLTSI